MNKFYDFEHECDTMPEGVRFCKINGSSFSQFTFDKYTCGIGVHSTTLYGFRYCPYCGEDMEADNDN